MDDPIPCSVCGRSTPPEYQEKHHLVPKSRKGKETVPVCINCGDQLHTLFTLKEMRDSFNTLEKILADERIQEWVRWIRKRHDFKVCQKRKKKRG